MDGTKYPGCKCGTRWRQHGNRSGHCTACHRTFSSGAAFDQHQKISGGKVTCLDPAEIGLVARVDDIGTEQWGGPAYEGATRWFDSAPRRGGTRADAPPEGAPPAPGQTPPTRLCPSRPIPAPSGAGSGLGSRRE